MHIAGVLWWVTVLIFGYTPFVVVEVVLTLVGHLMDPLSIFNTAVPNFLGVASTKTVGFLYRNFVKSGVVL